METAELTELKWDSDFFERRICRLDVGDEMNDTAIINTLEGFSGDLVYVFSPRPLNISISGFMPADRKIVYEKPISNSSTGEDKEIIQANRLNDRLVDLALVSGNHSRFKNDSVLAAYFEKFYTLWISKSVNGELADKVYVVKGDKGEELGFVTIKRSGKAATIGLIAVDEKSQGLKIGSRLMHAAEAWAGKSGANMMLVATQADNVQACGFYEKNGYKVQSETYIYHYHKNAK
jgi:dTDP-4-amino-4,6-dideoxy-D-galactose acyltransferase